MADGPLRKDSLRVATDLERLKQRLIQTNVQRDPKEFVCPVRRFLNELAEQDPEAASLVEGLVDNQRISTFRLYTELHYGGMKISRESLTAHRRNMCRCRENKE